MVCSQQTSGTCASRSPSNCRDGSYLLVPVLQPLICVAADSCGDCSIQPCPHKLAGSSPASIRASTLAVRPACRRIGARKPTRRGTMRSSRRFPRMINVLDAGFGRSRATARTRRRARGCRRSRSGTRERGRSRAARAPGGSRLPRIRAPRDPARWSMSTSPREEHREHGHHLGFEEQMIEVPDRSVEPLKPAAAHRVAVRDPGPAEGDDVHRQDAEQGEPAKNIDRGQPLGRRTGSARSALKSVDSSDDSSFAAILNRASSVRDPPLP